MRTIHLHIRKGTSLDFLNSKKGLALVGVLVGLGMALLAFSGNPANMAMCAACFIRDMAGSPAPNRSS